MKKTSDRSVMKEFRGECGAFFQEIASLVRICRPYRDLTGNLFTDSSTHRNLSNCRQAGHIIAGDEVSGRESITV